MLSEWYVFQSLLLINHSNPNQRYSKLYLIGMLVLTLTIRIQTKVIMMVEKYP